MSATMKNLIIRPADVSLNPLGAASNVADVEVTVTADRFDLLAAMFAIGAKPTGSSDPDPVHPFRAVGAVTVARIEKRWLRG